GGIDDRDTIGRAEGNEGGLAVFGHADAHGLDGLAPQARNVERDLVGHHSLGRVDDRNGAADLRRYPHFGIITLELGEARAGIYQDVGDDLARRGVDEMRHVGGFGSIDQDLAVGADGHTLRLDADLNLAETGALFDVDDRHRVVVFVGDVEDLAGSVECEQL